ncbi:MGH1-like glycoside hydrolase domain-containing protein [Streptomyces humi]|uniref:MGH1-like glycoside hydrolase domain-containing protein n=1 Tax=Streptomyces humi TaxID=1428620 RepID=UPI00069C8B5D|nr:trehalase family glycosidase [Streptomyces humi]
MSEQGTTARPATAVPAPTGWNTWDVRTHTGMSRLPSGPRLRLGLLGPDGPVLDGFTWRDGLERLGPHTVDGSHAEVTVRAAGRRLRLLFAGGPGDVLHVRAETTGRLVLALEGLTGANGPQAASVGTGAPPESPGGTGGIGGSTVLPGAPGGVGGSAVLPGVPGGVEGAAESADVAGGAGGTVGSSDAPGGSGVPARASGAVGAYVVGDGCAGGMRWAVTASAPARRLAGPADELLLVFGGRGAGSGTVDLRIAPAGVPGTVAETGGVLAAGRAAADRTLPRSGGWLGAAADALTRAVTWNTVHAPDLGRVLTPTSRDFVCAARQGFYGTWALHAWDTFFTGLAASAVDRDYARGIFTQILPYADRSGMLPNRVSDDRGRTDDRSQPPVGALTVHQAYLAGGLSDGTRDTALLHATFPALLAWHDWWPRARRGPHGLLAWGSDPVVGDPGSATLDRARRESGLDDSPMYDEARYDPVTHTMDLADVGLNALHIADAEALAEMAGLLGEDATAGRLRAEAATAARAADLLLWDGARGGYRNLTSAGVHDPHVSPTMLYALLGGLPDAGRASAVAADLLRPEVLGGARPLPSVARDDPGFAATYWRGRIWAPMAYLAVRGLRRYGLTELSRPVVGALLRLFLDEWREYGHVRENYPAVEGENLTGLEKRSDGLMAWGGLLAYLAFGELADARPDGWRFAHPGEPAELRNLPLGEGRLDVRAADRLTVRLDGRVLLDLAPGVVVHAYRRTGDRVTGTAEGTGDLLVTPPGGGPPVRWEVRGGARSFGLGPDAEGTGDATEGSGT